MIFDWWDLEWKPFSAIVSSVETWGFLQPTRALAGSENQKPFDRWKGKFWAALFTTAFFCKLEACIHEQSCIVGVVVHQSFHSSHFVAKVGWQRRASLLWWWIQRVERFSLGTCHELWYLTFFEAAQCPTAREISAESYEQLSSCGLRLRLPPSPSRFRSESWGLRVDVIWSKQRTCGIELNANFIDFYQVWTQRLFFELPFESQTNKQQRSIHGSHRPRLCRFAPFVCHHRSGCLRLGARCLPPASPGLDASTRGHTRLLEMHWPWWESLLPLVPIVQGSQARSYWKTAQKRNIHSNYSWQLER